LCDNDAACQRISSSNAALQQCFLGHMLLLCSFCITVVMWLCLLQVECGTRNH
jgi:hypothetical protein